MERDSGKDLELASAVQQGIHQLIARRASLAYNPRVADLANVYYRLRRGIRASSLMWSDRSRRLVPFMLVLATACTLSGAQSSPALSPSQPSPSPTSLQPAAIVYAAVGASDGLGVGATNPAQDAWPQVFFRTALPKSTVMYNFSISGAKVASALTDEVPKALAVEPTLVTVWLNANDLVAGIGPSQYANQLARLVHELRRGGAAQVLVANTPELDQLPLYVRCRAGEVTCPQVLKTSSPEQLRAEVTAYNSGIASVVKREGAILVDLHALGEIPLTHPDWISSDGFHPSTSGYAVVAATFAAALKEAS